VQIGPTPSTQIREKSLYLALALDLVDDDEEAQEKDKAEEIQK
jgi:hypothetical protein